MCNKSAEKKLCSLIKAMPPADVFVCVLFIRGLTLGQETASGEVTGQTLTHRLFNLPLMVSVGGRVLTNYKYLFYVTVKRLDSRLTLK